MFHHLLPPAVGTAVIRPAVVKLGIGFVMILGVIDQPVRGEHQTLRAAVTAGVIDVALVILSAGLLRQQTLKIAELIAADGAAGKYLLPASAQK